MHRALLLMAAEAIPVVDVDNTIFIQGGLFLVLIFILKPLLFDPWLAARDRRAQRIGGAHEEAALMRDQIRELKRSTGEETGPRPAGSEASRAVSYGKRRKAQRERA